MRYLIVLTAFLLTACALPGLSGLGSSMIATQPTQEYCTARGLTLDATSKQCVVSLGSERTDSLPSKTVEQSSPPRQQGLPQPQAQQPRPHQAQPQQAQQALAQPQQPSQSQRSTFSVPIEDDATIRPASRENSETAVEFAHFVRASGYRCDSISALAPRPGAFTLACNRSTFRYSIKSRDGGWIVTIE